MCSPLRLNNLSGVAASSLQLAMLSKTVRASSHSKAFGLWVKFMNNVLRVFRRPPNLPNQNLEHKTPAKTFIANGLLTAVPAKTRLQFSLSFWPIALLFSGFPRFLFCSWLIELQEEISLHWRNSCKVVWLWSSSQDQKRQCSLFPQIKVCNLETRCHRKTQLFGGPKKPWQPQTWQDWRDFPYWIFRYFLQGLWGSSY